MEFGGQMGNIGIWRSFFFKEEDFFLQMLIFPVFSTVLVDFRSKSVRNISDIKVPHIFKY
jgi:hypothetical protein